MKEKEIQLKQRILDYAEQIGLSDENIEPIVDGTCDIDTYFQEDTRIMWVLKEPYDDFLEDGTPYGGGWDICDILKSDDAWKISSRKPIIYVSYAFFNNIYCWEDMDYIEDCPQMAEVLQRIAYINMSKMPAKTISPQNMSAEYEKWRPILLEQIKLYDPHIIIFGNTFKYFEKDLLNGNYKKDTSNDDLYVYECNGKLFLDAYHPQQRTITKSKYVDDILKAMRKFIKKV